MGLEFLIQIQKHMNNHSLHYFIIHFHQHIHIVDYFIISNKFELINQKDQ